MPETTTTQFPVVPGSLTEPSAVPRTFRAFCATEGVWIGPPQTSFRTVLGDAQRHRQVTSRHQITIFSE
jgi:hypothetical protein